MPPWALRDAGADTTSPLQARRHRRPLGAAGGYQDLQAHSHLMPRSSTTTPAYTWGKMVGNGDSGMEDIGTTGTGNAANMPPALILNYVIKT